MRTRFECLAIRGMETLREEDGKVDEEFNQRARGRAWRKRALKHCSLVGAFVTLGCGQRLVREKKLHRLHSRLQMRWQGEPCARVIPFVYMPYWLSLAFAPNFLVAGASRSSKWATARALADIWPWLTHCSRCCLATIIWSR